MRAEPQAQSGSALAETNSQEVEALRAEVATLQSALLQNDERLQALEIEISDMSKALARLTSDLSVAHADQAGLEHAATSPGGFPYLPRNTPLYFTSDQDVGVFLYDGWWPAEHWGVWGKGARHSLRFSMDESYLGGFADLFLHIQGFAIPQAQPAIHLMATANGYFVGRFIVKPQPHRIRLRLSPSCIGNGDVLLQLEHSDPFIPSDHLDTDDPRQLGLGLISLEIR